MAKFGSRQQRRFIGVMEQLAETQASHTHIGPAEGQVAMEFVCSLIQLHEFGKTRTVITITTSFVNLKMVCCTFHCIY